MTCSWTDRLLIWLLAVAAPAAPLGAQQVREIGVQAVGTASDPALAVVGVSGGLRVSPRTRIAAFLGGGVRGDHAAWRGELLGHFLLNPTARDRPGLYGGGGLAAVGAQRTRGYAVLLIGLESRPGGPAGWSVELGVGGGLRLALGYHWRHRAAAAATP